MSESPQPDREQLPLAVEQQIDRLSDEFERDWRSGHPPRIEDYLDRVLDRGSRGSNRGSRGSRHAAPDRSNGGDFGSQTC